jgi:flagellar biosynthesis protein FlhA
MPEAARTNKRGMSDAAVAGVVLLILAIMIVPVPTWILDGLLVLDLALALVILLVTIYIQQPLRFNVFPTLLLLATLYRLALNVAATRTILLHANGGKVIGAFGNFVVGGNYAVGIIAFLILTIIQFVVITKGSGRIAEVAARFTLDAMPGRQMAIDADLNAGLIDEHEARQRRLDISRQADFYGAMDGAAKFVRGDSIAAVIIVIINIIGGFIVGVLQHGMSMSESLRTYTLLTVGDGLVAQIPALVVSTASGILITRSDGQGALGKELGSQLFREPRAAIVGGIILAMLGIVPGMPALPFLLLGGVSIAAGMAARRGHARTDAIEAEAVRSKTAQTPEKVERLLSVDPLELEIGFGLVPLVDEGREGGDLLRRVTLVRRQCATDLGLVVPAVRVRDNIRLPQDTYVVLLKGIEVARGVISMGNYLAMSPGSHAIPVDGVETVEPVFGLKAVWISPDRRGEAEVAGYTVVEPSAVMATHLAETIKSHADEILGRQEVQVIIDQVKQRCPAVVEELIPTQLTVGGVQKVLQRLLRERVSIRDMVSILEALADFAPMTKDLDTLVEKVREGLGRAITQQYRDGKGNLSVISIEPSLEQELIQSVKAGEGGGRLILPPEDGRRLLELISDAVHRALSQTAQPVLLCSPYLRPYLRGFLERALPHVAVLSYGEVISAGTVKTVASVKVEHAYQEV